MELTWILGVIRRRKWTIVQSFAVVTLVALIGSFLVVPTYLATSKVVVKNLLEKTAPTSAIPGISVSLISSILTAPPNKEMAKVQATSTPSIEKMALRLQLRDDEGNVIPAMTLTQTGIFYAMKGIVFPKPNITIAPYEDTTNTLIITATSPNPDEVAIMADALAEIMIEQSREQVRAEYRSARVFLNDEIQKVKQHYTLALSNYANFKKSEKTVDLGEESKLAIAKMSELLKQKEDIITRLGEAQAKLRQLKQELARQNINYIAPTTLVTNPQIEAIKRRLAELQLQLSDATSRLTEKHPVVRSLRDQIQSANSELKKELDAHRISAPELASIELETASLEAQLKGVNADIANNTAILETFPDKASGQADVDMELNVSQRVYGSLLDYLYQIGVTEAITLSEIRIVDPAMRPLYPNSPSKLLNMLVGMFLGTFFGFGLVFLIEYLDDVVRSTDDMKVYKPMVLIGAIPKLHKKRKAFLGEIEPDDAFYESYRNIRTYIKHAASIGEKPLHTFLITSPGPKEGKSTTVANLGICFARDGQRVLLVDAHLSGPGLHTCFNLPNTVGVSPILEGKASLEESIQATEFQGVAVLTSGPMPDDSDKLIESDRMARMILDLAARFDTIILDSAPLLLKSDALLLMKYVDATLIVLESGKTPRLAVQQLMEILDSNAIKPLGFVLNKLSMSEGRFYRQHHASKKSLLARTGLKKRSQ